MIKHIVTWKINEKEEKQKTALQIKEKLEALDNYQVNPLHLEAVTFIKEKTHSRVLTDYKI